MNKNILYIAILILVMVIIFGYSNADKQVHIAYYRGVWNTCLYGVINQAQTLEHTLQVCEVAYNRAIIEHWFDRNDWPAVP